jgi:hypothetical protein
MVEQDNKLVKVKTGLILYGYPAGIVLAGWVHFFYCFLSLLPVLHQRYKTLILIIYLYEEATQVKGCKIGSNWQYGTFKKIKK